MVIIAVKNESLERYFALKRTRIIRRRHFKVDFVQVNCDMEDNTQPFFVARAAIKSNAWQQMNGIFQPASFLAAKVLRDRIVIFFKLANPGRFFVYFRLFVQQ